MGSQGWLAATSIKSDEARRGRAHEARQGRARLAHATKMEDARTRVSTLKDEGNGKLKSGDLEQAVALYQQAAAEAALLPPEELASVWSNLALALFKQGSAAESVAAADKCIAAKPEWHKAHYRRGDALFYLRRYTEARDSYARAQELAADDREVAAALALTAEAVQGGVWFRQLLPGREFAVQASSPMEELIFGAARQMQNHIYVVGCATTRECYVVDSCWDTDGIAGFARRNKMKLIGAIGTHYHFDHCGGEVPPQMAAMVSGPFGGKPTLPGLREMKRDHGAAVHIHAREVERIAKQCDLDLAEISPLEQGARLPLGEAGEIEVLHTLGHS